MLPVPLFLPALAEPGLAACRDLAVARLQSSGEAWALLEAMDWLLPVMDLTTIKEAMRMMRVAAGVSSAGSPRARGWSLYAAMQPSHKLCAWSCAWQAARGAQAARRSAGLQARRSAQHTHGLF